MAEKIIDDNPAKNTLRKWITLKLRSDESASRLEPTSNDESGILKAMTSRGGSYPTHDLLSYCSIIK